MTKDEALKMAIETMESTKLGDMALGLAPSIILDDTINACKEALEQPAQRNFCERCGKRASKDSNHIHTCTPPQALKEKNT